MPKEKKASRGRPRKLTPEQAKANRTAVTAKWKKANTTVVTVMLHKKKDGDLIDWLDRHKPKNRYIRDLIRADMERNGD